MRIILIGNYPPDKQESMERFAQMLNVGFQNMGIKTEIWRPNVFFGRLVRQTGSGLGKWVGYIDKWIVFPLVLRWRLTQSDQDHSQTRFHVCDHSNAPYLAHLPADRTGVTCHDVLAIRGAMGFPDAYCPASGFGKILQKWILRNLLRSRSLAAVSELTMRHLNELAANTAPSRHDWRVIHNTFNDTFWPMPEDDARLVLKQRGVEFKRPFILHVGSSMARKNRRMLLDMVSLLGDKWQGMICFAGHPIDDDLSTVVQSYGLTHRVVEVSQPDHNQLVALYSLCEAFIFPSFSEGFGWPLIEAQACGAPVIASNVEPMPEVSGGVALYADPNRPSAFAEALLRLQQPDTRTALIQDGTRNAARFDPDQIINAYLDMHGMNLAIAQ